MLLGIDVIGGNEILGELLFLGLGGSVLGARTDEGRAPKLATILHGVGLLVMLVGGFGMLARLGIVNWPWPGWALGKMGVWLAIGALPVLVRRKVLPRGVAWLVAAALAATAAWLALYKPF